MYASVIYGLVCILLPGIAWLVINQSWEFQIPLIDKPYKPWKLFLVVCGLPSLLCSFIFVFLPESPKFVLAQGNQERAIEILEKMNRWNNGSQCESLQIRELYEDAESIASRKKREENQSGNYRLLKSIWTQTAPLFMSPHLRTTLLACAIQFGIFVTSNGMYMWFPDILNRVVTNMNNHPDDQILMCQIVYNSRPNGTGTEAAIGHNIPKV